MIINTWTIRSVTVALAGLALTVGGSRSQGQALKEEAAKAPGLCRDLDICAFLDKSETEAGKGAGK